MYTKINGNKEILVNEDVQIKLDFAIAKTLSCSSSFFNSTNTTVNKLAEKVIKKLLPNMPKLNEELYDDSICNAMPKDDEDTIPELNIHSDNSIK